MKLRDVEVGKVYELKADNVRLGWHLRVLKIEQGKYPENTTERITVLHCNYTGSDPEVAATRWQTTEVFAGMLEPCEQTELDFEETYKGQFE